MALQETFLKLLNINLVLTEEEMKSCLKRLEDLLRTPYLWTSVLHYYYEYPIDVCLNHGTRTVSDLNSISRTLMQQRLLCIFGLSSKLTEYNNLKADDENKKETLLQEMQRRLNNLGNFLMDTTKVHPRELLALKSFHPINNVEFLVVTFIASEHHKMHYINRCGFRSTYTQEHIIRGLWNQLQKDDPKDLTSVKASESVMPYYEWFF